MSEREQEVDDLLIDALLIRVHQHDQLAVERRVEGVLDRLRREHWDQAEPRPRIPRWTLRLGGALFAAAVVFVAIFWNSGNAYAMQVVERSIQTMAALVDRQYSFVIETKLGASVERSEGDLFVRGSGEIAIRAERQDVDLWVGKNSQESWVVPTHRLLPVITEEPGMLIEKILPEQDTSLPLLRVTSTLQRMKDAYELTYRETEGGLDEVTGVFRGGLGDETWPTSVVLMADEAGVVTSLVMHCPAFRGAGERSVVLQLLGSEPKPDGFYHHQAHHAGRRVIERR